MSLPPLDSIEDIEQMFKTLPSPGMKVESSLSAPFFFFLSKVIWVENVEVKDCKVDDDDDIQSGTMNSNPAFTTKHYVNILSSICRRTCAKHQPIFVLDPKNGQVGVVPTVDVLQKFERQDLVVHLHVELKTKPRKFEASLRFAKIVVAPAVRELDAVQQPSNDRHGNATRPWKERDERMEGRLGGVEKGRDGRLCGSMGEGRRGPEEMRDGGGCKGKREGKRLREGFEHMGRGRATTRWSDGVLVGFRKLVGLERQIGGWKVGILGERKRRNEEEEEEKEREKKKFHITSEEKKERKKK
ncbi:hypothetical protein TB2_035070 [Malus domestica]